MTLRPLADGHCRRIAHTEGYSAAVVIWQGSVRSLGLDAERVAAVYEELGPRIRAPAELRNLRAFHGTLRDERAAVTGRTFLPPQRVRVGGRCALLTERPYWTVSLCST